MAIVPLTRDVSMKTIREVINQKAVVLGQVRHRGTTYDRYGKDLDTGEIVVRLKNISNDSITMNIYLTVNGVALNNVAANTRTIAAGERTTVVFSGLDGKLGPYNKLHHIGNIPAASYTGNYNYAITIKETSGSLARQDIIENINIATSGGHYRFEHAAVLFQSYPLVDISIQDDDGSITSNYVRKDGVQIPGTVTQEPSKLSSWRGAQVFHGTAVTRTSGKGRYGGEKHQGYIHIYLDPNFFSDGPVTITLPNVKAITRTISTGSRVFKFNELHGGKSYTIYIKDEITGNEVSQTYSIDSTPYGSSLKTKTFSFNGESRMLAFTI